MPFCTVCMLSNSTHLNFTNIHRSKPSWYLARFGAPGTTFSPKQDFFLLCYVLSYFTYLSVVRMQAIQLLLCSCFVWRIDILLYVYPPLITLQLYIIYLDNHAMKSFTHGIKDESEQRFIEFTRVGCASSYIINNCNTGNSHGVNYKTSIHIGIDLQFYQCMPIFTRYLCIRSSLHAYWV